MKALSVKQPWADLIASGQKTIETRNWYTPYRGNILICSSKEPDKIAMVLLEKTALQFVRLDWSIADRCAQTMRARPFAIMSRDDLPGCLNPYAQPNRLR
jgi:hypothetical protein